MYAGLCRLGLGDPLQQDRRMRRFLREEQSVVVFETDLAVAERGGPEVEKRWEVVAVDHDVDVRLRHHALFSTTLPAITAAAPSARSRATASLKRVCDKIPGGGVRSPT